MVNDRSGLKFLLDNARTARSLDEPLMVHLTSRIALLDYVRVADEVAATVKAGRLLDWGCGYGQMSYLLKKRGFDVISYAIGDGGGSLDHRLPLVREISPIIGSDEVGLPFKDGEFDAVLSCGVLEHVADEEASLEEIRRVLVRGGTLLIYNLPQKRSYKELLIKKFNLGYFHERTYTGAKIQSMLKYHGFKVRRMRRGGFLPHLLSGMPRSIKLIWDSVAPIIFAIDRALSRIPLLNRTAEALEVVASKEPT